jgi:hypothetical protein
MTGIGFANLAAWVAHRALAGQGTHRPLMAEIGAYGYAPQVGDPFIFSHRNLPTCTWMTGVTEILGAVLAGDHGGALAVLGAGTVDRNGNMNSSRSASGRFLVGSGGAADIASGAEEVVVVIKHGIRRLVERVPFVTCPATGSPRWLRQRPFWSARRTPASSSSPAPWRHQGPSSTLLSRRPWPGSAGTARCPRTSSPSPNPRRPTSRCCATSIRAAHSLEVARIGGRLGASCRSGVPSVEGPCLADEATQRDDGVGEVEERVDDGLFPLVAALGPVEVAGVEVHGDVVWQRADRVEFVEGGRTD